MDTRLANGSRVNIVLQPIAIDGSAISIRKFPEQPFVMEDLIRFGAITEEAAEFLKVLVLSGYNIFVSGGTGSGKTTFLNALSQFIPREERIITIEDSAELQLIDKPNLVRLETRNANTEGVLPIHDTRPDQNGTSHETKPGDCGRVSWSGRHWMCCRR